MKRLVIFTIVVFSIVIAMIVWENIYAQTKPVSNVKVLKEKPKKIKAKKRLERSEHHVSRSYVRIPLSNEKPRYAGPEPKLDLRNHHLWILIHKCEGGWKNHSNFEGGLQFLHSTWVSAGGRAFAEHSYQATPEEQITVANWYSHGGAWLAPWPVCGKKAAHELGLAFP